MAGPSGSMQNDARIMMARMTRARIVLIVFAAMTLPAGRAIAQVVYTAPMSDACKQGFVPLREEAEERGKLIRAASARHAPLDEACELIGNFARSELKMIRYIEASSAKCGIPTQVADQLKAGHEKTEAMQTKVCALAQARTSFPADTSHLNEMWGPQKREPAGPVGDFDRIR